MQDTLLQHRYLDRCQATTGWTVLGNDTINLATTTRCIHGSAALEFDKVDGAANTVFAGIQKTLSSEDLNQPGGFKDVSPHDILQWWVYVSALTNVDYTFVRLGTSASAYVEYRFQDDEMTAGRFTHCARPLALYDTSASTRINWGDIDYIAVGVAFDAETDTLADIAVGAISIMPAGMAGNSISVGDVEAEVTLDSEGVTNTAAPSHTLQVGGRANASAPTFAEGALDPMSFTLTGELRTRVDLAQAVPAGTAPSQMVIVGAVAETTVPTPVTDGQTVRPNYDEYGRPRVAGYDESEDAIGTVIRGDLTRVPFGPLAFTALTAAGSTAAQNVEGYKHLTWQIVIASIDTSVDVRVEGSLDNTSWFNMNDAGVDTQYTANGTYSLRASNRAVKYTRLTFVSELGGSAVTVTGTLMAGN